MTEYFDKIDVFYRKLFTKKLNFHANKIHNILWSDLVALKNASKLIPGMKYRIINYVTTSTQANTSVANKYFDIVVTAISTNTLDENASCLATDRTTGTSTSGLCWHPERWTIKYCLTNDITRFAWASSLGTGVIYYMKDEFDNEAPYDFKNILFKNIYIFDYTKYTYDNVNKPTLTGLNYSILSTTSTAYYTFSGPGNVDGTTLSSNYVFMNNHISVSKDYIDDVAYQKLYLPFVVIIGNNCKNNYITNCKNCTFEAKQINNTYYDWSIFNNTFNNCKNFYVSCFQFYNSILNGCEYSTIISAYNSSTIDNHNCAIWNLKLHALSCSYLCCMSNIRNICTTRGMRLHMGILNSMQNCQFRENSYINIISNNTGYVLYNDFRASSSYININTNGWLKNCIFDTEVCYLNIEYSGSAPNSLPSSPQNIYVHSGVNGTASAYKTITKATSDLSCLDVYPAGSTQMEL
jgi:hypothetical protein